MDRPLRIAWFSNAPWKASGYGTQTALVTRALKAAGHEVAILCSHEHQPLHEWHGIPVYPAGFSPWSQDVIGPWSQHFNADITVLFLDAWIHQPGMWGESVRAVPLFPVDHECLLPPIAQVVGRSWQGITYSRFGQEEARKAGLETLFVPHAVDTKAYRPIGRTAARKHCGIPEDAFVVGVVAANNDPTPTRKNWEGILSGFWRFKKRHPSALLYMHTYLSGQYDLDAEIRRLGLEKSVLFSNEVQMRLGLVRPDDMAALYSAFDVLLAPSRGEGFCLPVLEAQACACPVITGDWTATGEIAFGGVVIDKSQATRVRMTDPNNGASLYHYLAGPEVIDAALTAVYDASPEVRQQMREDAYRGAQAYDIAAVLANYWLPALEQMAVRIAQEAGAA